MKLNLKRTLTPRYGVQWSPYEIPEGQQNIEFILVVKTLRRGSELRETSERNVGGVRESRRRVGKSERYHAGVKTWLQL